MATADWKQFIDQTNGRMAKVRAGIPDVAKGFRDIAQAAIAPGALDSKTKELIAVAIGVAVRCDGCIAYHVKAAIRHGATREEVLETVGVGVYMGGGPSMIYGAEALDAYDALTA